MHATGNKRGKTRASEARLVLVLRLVGRESGANFVNQSQSVVKQNQSKREIAFDTQLKTTLAMRLSNFFVIIYCSRRLDILFTALYYLNDWNSAGVDIKVSMK